MEIRCTKPSAAVALLGAVLILTSVVGMLPNQAWATHVCADAASFPSRDTDGDGLTDLQECNAQGITTAGSKNVAATFPKWDGNPATRQNSVDPDTKDVFIILVTAGTSSLLDQAAGGSGLFFQNQFIPMLPSFSPLGVTAHALRPTQVNSDRTFVSKPSPSPQKAIRVAESLDANGSILGSCTWGTPLNLDGCAVFTQRIYNHITSVCTSAGDPNLTTKRTQFLIDISLWAIRHEAGHVHGGLAGSYVAKDGGYHYPCGSGTTMEQCLSYSTTGGVCNWTIPSGWNTTLDPPSVHLK